MQTRLQTKLAREAAEAEARANADATALSATTSSNHLRSFDSMSSLSSVSTLTPTNSFSWSDAGSATPTPDGGNLDAIAEADEDEEQDDEVWENTHVPPMFPFVRSSQQPLITPQPSLNPAHRFPPEVFQAPKKHVSPSERERLAAERARDSVLAGSRGLARLTEQGTLLNVESARESSLSPEPSSSDRGMGHGLGSPFVSQQHAGPLKRRQTAHAYRQPIESIPTILVDPNTGEVLKYPVARE